MQKSGSLQNEKSPPMDMTKEQLNYHFYKEYWRLYIAQEIIKSEIDKIKKECEQDPQTI